MAHRNLGIGLYGRNGHQIQRRLIGHPQARLVAVAGIPADRVPPECGDVRRYDSLDALLDDTDVALVSLCSPRRADQAADAVRCLTAGRHVYAEKPAALTEADLDAILATAGKTGMQFHEMAGTLVQQPYRRMRELIADGAVGTVVQVFAQKCYPWYDRRPADEAIDGGLATQAGVYAARFVEHVAGVKLASLQSVETTLGNPVPASQCRRAVSMMMALANGGVASAVVNYLNPMRQRVWGYEILRVFGTDGIIESNADGDQARLLALDREPEALDVSDGTLDYFDLFVRSLVDGEPMPLSLDDELSPTRWVIRAKKDPLP